MIVGAGPIGLSLAIMLKKSGASLFRIIEKNAGPSTATKAMAIHSRTLEIFFEIWALPIRPSATGSLSTSFRCSRTPNGY
ncbi:FAD-dependent monooxygenase [Pseudomonas lini]